MFACAVTKAGALATSSKQHSFKKLYGDLTDNWNDHSTKQNKDDTAPTHTQKTKTTHAHSTKQTTNTRKTTHKEQIKDNKHKKDNTHKKENTHTQSKAKTTTNTSK